jgi:hypothetical protein
MHCKSVSCNLILGNLLIFQLSPVDKGIKQSLKMSNQKSHRGIARLRDVCVMRAYVRARTRECLSRRLRQNCVN